MSSDKNELANQSYFLDAWLLMPQFFWVKRAKVNTDYKCKLCNKENKLSNLGVKALEKYVVGATHKQMLDIHEKNKYFFKPQKVRYQKINRKHLPLLVNHRQHLLLPVNHQHNQRVYLLLLQLPIHKVHLLLLQPILHNPAFHLEMKLGDRNLK